MSRRKKILISLLILITIFCIVIYTNTNSVVLSRIEKVIRHHNAIKDYNPKYPTVSEPPSSQSTVIYGDSVMVIKKEFANKPIILNKDNEGK